MTDALKLLEKLNAAGVKFTLTANGKLLVDAPKSVITIQWRESLQTHKTALLELLRRQANKDSNADDYEEPEFNQTPPTDCPICSCTLASDDGAALLVRYCPLGCEFVWRRFNDWQAAYDLAKKMFDAATFDEHEAMTDALTERAHCFAFENGWDYERALQAAESDLIPLWLDIFNLRKAIAESLR